MLSSALGFILGFIAAVFLFAICAPFLWRRAMVLAHKAARGELPLSLKEVEADRDFLRARHAVDICRLEEELALARQSGHEGLVALSRGREQLSRLSALEAKCGEQSLALARQEQQIAALKALNQDLKDKAQAELKLKKADLSEFRRQIKQIAAQTAGFIAGEEGADSPILRLVKAEKTGGAGLGAGKEASLAAAIAEEAAALQKKRARAPAKNLSEKAGERKSR